MPKTEERAVPVVPRLPLRIGIAGVEDPAVVPDVVVPDPAKPKRFPLAGVKLPKTARPNT